MRGLGEFSKMYLYRGLVDFRKGITGLSYLVQEDMGLSVTSGATLYIFCNRDRSQLKILYFDKNGFALWLKRLEKPLRFSWPKNSNEAVINISVKDLEMLLDGVNIWTRFKSVYNDCKM